MSKSLFFLFFVLCECKKVELGCLIINYETDFSARIQNHRCLTLGKRVYYMNKIG